MLTFAMLFVYYRFFHPWKSEGISVGFTPGKDTLGSIVEHDYDKTIDKIKPSGIKPSKNSFWQTSNLNDGKLYR